MVHIASVNDLSMKITFEVVRGKRRPVLDFGERDGRRHRRYFKTEADALKALRKAEKEMDLAGRWWAAVSVADKQDYIGVLKQMRQAGVHPADVWAAYTSREITCQERRTLREAIKETIEAKGHAGRKSRYLRELEAYLWRFAKGREDLPVDKITPQEIDRWFASRKEGAETRMSNTGRLSSMFGLCHRRGYIPSNPCKGAEVVSMNRKPPHALDAKSFGLMLNVCRKRTPDLLGYLVLGGFLGIRPDELQSMMASNVNLKQRRVTIDFHTSKIRAWRIIDIPWNVVAWLKLCPTPNGKVAPARSTLRKARRKLREALGMGQWPQDILRHSAASHLLAFYDGDEAKVAAMLGTSPRVLHRRYKNLVTKQEAKKFMAIRP